MANVEHADIDVDNLHAQIRFRQGTAPVTFNDGDLWFDTDNNRLFVADAAAWEEVTADSEAHTHPASDITDFAEAVDDRVGALVADSTSIDVTYNDAGNAFSIAVIDEYIRDLVGTFLTPGQNIDITVDDPGNTVTIAVENLTLADITDAGTMAAATEADYYTAAEVDALVAGGGYTNEQAQDAVGTILADSSSINFTYTDGTPEITAEVILEWLQDAIAAMFTGGTHTNLTATYQDAGGVIDLAASGGGGTADGFPYYGWPSGKYQNLYQTAGHGALASMAVVANRVYCGTPIFFHRGANVTAMGIFVHSAAASGKIARLGLYAIGADGIPTTPAFDAGTVLVDAIGAREITGLSLLVTADTWYVPAMVTDGTPSVSHAQGTSAGFRSNYGHSSITNVPAHTHTVYDNVAGTAFGNPFVADGYHTSGDGISGPMIVWIKQG